MIASITQFEENRGDANLESHSLLRREGGAMSRISPIVVGCVLILGVSVGASAKPRIERTSFGKTADGVEVDLYTLTNSRGMTAKITNYGGIVVSLLVPDRNGKLEDIVLGYDTLDGYVKNNPYFGCIVGRYGNRIAKGRFVLDGKTFTLAKNNGENHLHGGLKGFDKVVWKARPVSADDGIGLELNHVSRDGDEGYPGNLSVTVTYTLSDTDELRIDYLGTTDKPTVVNLTHHSYFNLDGAEAGDILGHELLLNADRFTPVDSGLIPTGDLRAVAATPMDFTRPAVIGARIESKDEQLAFARGYDHNWVLNRKGRGLSPAAKLVSRRTGRAIEILTTEPGIQFYSGNFLDGTITGKGGKIYKQRSGLCLETQHYPDAPNHPGFPTTVLTPGETYRTTTIYRFSVVKP